MKSVSKIIYPLSLFGLMAFNSHATPTTHGAALPLPPATISLTSNCPQGGTSATDGTYDLISGELNLTTTLTACTLKNGEVHDGTRVTTGTLLQKDNLFTVKVDTTESFTATSTVNSTSVKHNCTISQDGEFDTKTNQFNGSNTRNCSNDGVLQNAGGIVGHLLKEADLGFIPDNSQQNFKPNERHEVEKPVKPTNLPPSTQPPANGNTPSKQPPKKDH